MADLVQQHMEDMIPEISCLEKTNLLDKEEREKLIEDRREFEYKLAKLHKHKKDFIAYASYDIDLLTQLTERRKNLNIADHKVEIEGSIMKRVEKRLQALTFTYQNDLNCWNLRINFCKSMKKLNYLVSGIYDEQVKLLGKHENIWIEWAKWEMLGNNYFAEARKILLSRAPLYHPNSFHLAKEHFRLELLYVEYLKSFQKTSEIETLDEIPLESRKKLLKGKLAKVVYENCKEAFASAEVNREFYLIAEKFPFAKKIQEILCSEMMELYPGDADTWLINARRTLRSCNNLDDIEKIFQDLDNGLEKVGNSFINVYINETLCLLFHLWKHQNTADIIIEKLKKLLEENKGNLKTSFPWMLWVNLLKLDENSKDSRKAILLEAAKFVPACSLIRDTLLDKDQSKTEPDILTIKGIKSCRKYYKAQSSLPPFATQIHINMLNRELRGKKVSVEDVRSIFEIAIRQFGALHPVLWLAYAEFEKKYGTAAKCTTVKVNAERCLNVDKFVEYKRLRLCLRHKEHTQSVDNKEADESPVIWSDHSLLMDGFDDSLLKDETLSADRVKLRESFFGNLVEVKKNLSNDNQADIKLDEDNWLVILSILLGSKVSFDSCETPSNQYCIEESTRKSISEMADKRLKGSKKIEYSTELEDKSEYGPIIDTEVEEILKKSDILRPDFLKQRTLPQYHVSKFKKKNLKKQYVPTTAGKGWFDMKAPKMTPEIQRDLAVFKMRSVLLPDRHYKTNLQNNPKFFQMGKVMDSHFDFYNRIPKKQRKNTFAEEIMANEEVISFQKRKYKEISVREDNIRKKRKFSKPDKKKKKKQ